MDDENLAPGRFFGPGDMQIGLSYRYQQSHRHFEGPHEQKHRTEERSQVINDLHLWDLNFQYAFDAQWSGVISLPFVYAERSSPLRDANRVVVDRSVVRAAGIGDLIFGVRRWVLDTDVYTTANFQLGLGIKAPTGLYGVDDKAKRLNGQKVQQNVDQSIQPGDGGWGVVLDANGFWDLPVEAFPISLYLSGSYLINPRNRNSVETFRTARYEETMSVPDAFVARGGFGFAVPFIPGLGAACGGRVEGIPPHDLVGESDGFRRPGIGISIEPTLSFGIGAHGIAVSVPVAIYRDRWKSSSDAKNDAHGDAAFADFAILAGYSFRF